MASVRVHLIRLSEIDWSESLPSYGEIGSAVREVISALHRIELLGGGWLSKGFNLLWSMYSHTDMPKCNWSRYKSRSFSFEIWGCSFVVWIFFPCELYLLNSVFYPACYRSQCMVQNANLFKGRCFFFRYNLIWWDNKCVATTCNHIYIFP